MGAHFSDIATQLTPYARESDVGEGGGPVTPSLTSWSAGASWQSSVGRHSPLEVEVTFNQSQELRFGASRIAQSCYVENSVRHLAWVNFNEERLLDLRMRNLRLRVEETWVMPLIEKVRCELADRGLRVRPRFWLSDEWFSPLGIPGVAIPFYLAHPRLMRLERRMMADVEGGTRSDCLKLLRHEVGHAVQSAYSLHRRRKWQRIFGPSTRRYPEYYRPRPASRDFVQHLDGWYAQAHPIEDFAETFAVWLAPRSRWRTRYATWPALEKLEYVDELMEELDGVRPLVNSRQKPGSLGSLSTTLREHYLRQTRQYRGGYSHEYDADLRRVFTDDPWAVGPTAAKFLRRNVREIRRRVAIHIGDQQFALEQVLKQMMGRCRELRLRLRTDATTTQVDFALVLAMHTVQKLHTQRLDLHAM